MLPNDAGQSPFAYQQRFRYFVRGQGTLPLTLGSTKLMAFGYNEVLMPVGHGDAALRLTQNRLSAGLGVPIGARQRVEVGYLNLWNALPARRVNEFNHTLTLAWYWTKTAN